MKAVKVLINAGSRCLLSTVRSAQFYSLLFVLLVLLLLLPTIDSTPSTPSTPSTLFDSTPSTRSTRFYSSEKLRGSWFVRRICSGHCLPYICNISASPSKYDTIELLTCFWLSGTRSHYSSH